MKKVLILIVIIFSSLILTSCEVKDYNDLKTVTHEKMFSVNTSSNNGYYIYVYEKTCTMCDKVKEIIFEYATYANGNDDERPMYKMNAADKKQNPYLGNSVMENEGVGSSFYKDVKIGKLPSLILVKNGKVLSIKAGKTAITNELEGKINNE